MLVVILVVALLILLKSCLDCPGLVPSLCCGESGSSELSSYHLEIVYKVTLPPPPTPHCSLSEPTNIKADRGSRESSRAGSEVDADTRL